MKVLITGAKGQLGIDLINVLGAEHEIFPYDVDEMDITDSALTREIILKHRPEVVIHSAAYTNVDACESNTDLAYKINAIGARNVAVACQEIDAKMVYVSTDYVFAGDGKEPYVEFDQVAPVSIYGKSKLAGEDLVKSVLNKYFICRTSWLYGKYGNNFVKTMLRLASEKDQLSVVNDQVGSPTYTVDLAKQINLLIKTNLFGTYHVSNNGNCSWYEFACKIFELAGVTIPVQPITSDQLDRAAKRPAYSIMRNYCLELQDIDIMRQWDEALVDYFK